MRFQKGHKGYWKGKKRELPWSIKPMDEFHKKKISLANTGKNHSEETKRKISEKKKGTIPWNKGKKFLQITGEKNYFWQGGKTPLNAKIRNSLEYKLWREAVFKRDNWTCVWCQERGGELQADHIKPFALYPELRFAIDNGRTLCVRCHRTTDTWGRKRK